MEEGGTRAQHNRSLGVVVLEYIYECTLTEQFRNSTFQNVCA